MTTPTYIIPIDTVQLAVYLGTVATAGPPPTYTYALLAMINTSRSVKRTAAATANEIPRTDDPTQPNKIMRTTVSLDTEITGSGMMDVASYAALDALVASGEPAQFQIVMNYVGGIIYTGQFVVTSLEITGAKHGEVVTATMTIMQADVIATSTVTTVQTL